MTEDILDVVFSFFVFVVHFPYKILYNKGNIKSKVALWDPRKNFCIVQEQAQPAFGSVISSIASHEVQEDNLSG